MSLEMTHDDVRAALAAEALDALDGDERDAVRAHLEGCPECRAELASLREAAAALALSAPYRPMERERSDRVRARLLARAAADAAPPPSAVPGVIPIERARRPAGVQVGWLAAASSLLLLLAAGAYALRLRERVDTLASRAEVLERERGELARRLEERERTIAGLAGPGTRVIDLASTRQQAPSGRMFWDPRTDRWTFFAHNLPAVRPGREYQLWLITPAGPVGAGTFTPAANGEAKVEATYDLPPDQLRAVAVTEEPAGGVPQPTGEVLILGNVAE